LGYGCLFFFVGKAFQFFFVTRKNGGTKSASSSSSSSSSKNKKIEMLFQKIKKGIINPIN
jgi:hypothetical protein